jgi:hypothetical protein
VYDVSTNVFVSNEKGNKGDQLNGGKNPPKSGKIPPKISKVCQHMKKMVTAEHRLGDQIYGEKK